MEKDEKNMDRRTFMKSTLAAGAGLALAGSMPGSVLSQSVKTDELSDLSLRRLSKMIHTGQLTSRKLVETYLERIKIYDGPAGLNAYITVAGNRALEQADRYDALAQKGQFKGPLHGLPLAVKDNLDTVDMPTTGGSKILNSWRPSRNANIVDKLEAAGAIILGKTNMHEFAFGITTNNTHYGSTKNPYDRSRIPGGSSGGSGAACAAGLCAGAIGTDTGGSVRIPASLCGVVGLKPTLGRVGRGGMMYLSFTRDVIGPITRTVADSALILEAMAGRDPRDPESVREPVPEYSRRLHPDIKGKKFGIPRKLFCENLHPDTLGVMDDTLKQIRDFGGIIKDVDVKHMETATSVGFNIVLTECIYHLEQYLTAFDPEATIEKYADMFGSDVRPPIVGSKQKPVPGFIYAKSVRDDRNRMIQGFKGAMKDVDALIFPTTPLPAAKIGDDEETLLLGKKVNTFLTFIRNCDPVSVVGYPAITVPGGYSKEGLPIGVQLVGKPWEEQALLNMAYGYEQATKVRKAPSMT